jgi:hypothetical protein
MLVVIGVAWALSRIPGLPLSARDAVLLGFGMSLCNLPATILVAAWLLVLLARLRYTPQLQQTTRRSFQLVQLFVAAVSIAALIALAASVPMGLLGTPEMHIVGNNSSAYDYHWFQDQSAKSVAHRLRLLAADVDLSGRDARLVTLARVRDRALGELGLESVHGGWNLATRQRSTRRIRGLEWPALRYRPRKGVSSMSRFVVIGGGHAAGQAVASLRQDGFEGEIVVIGDEPHVPYQRPPLSKQYLSVNRPSSACICARRRSTRSARSRCIWVCAQPGSIRRRIR